jgi:hypothetical protein
LEIKGTYVESGSTFHHQQEHSVFCFVQHLWVAPTPLTGPTLHEGEHTWPFTFTLPYLSSPSTYRGTKIAVVHEIRAVLFRQHADGDLVTTSAFHYVEPVALPTYPIATKHADTLTIRLRRRNRLQGVLSMIQRSNVKDAYVQCLLPRLQCLPGETIIVPLKLIVPQEHTPLMNVLFKVGLKQTIVYSRGGRTITERTIIAESITPYLSTKQEPKVLTLPIPRNLPPTSAFRGVMSCTYTLRIVAETFPLELSTMDATVKRTDASRFALPVQMGVFRHMDSPRDEKQLVLPTPPPVHDSRT